MRRYSPRTIQRYREVLQSFAQQCGGVIDTVSIRNYEVWLLDVKKEQPRSVNQQLSILSAYCKYLVRTGELASNPVRLVTRPKTPKNIPVFYRDEALEAYFRNTEADAGPDSLELLLALPATDKTAKELYTRRLHRLIISLLFGTGIRRSELIGLEQSSFDPARRTLMVRGKGDKMREIPLISSLCEEISLYLSAADAFLTGSQAPSLLRTPSGKRLYPVYVDRVVKQGLGATQGITGRKSPHVLRHSLASSLLDAGADLNAIKELLGHSSLAATQVYTHSSVERLRKVYENAHPRAKKEGNHGD